MTLRQFQRATAAKGACCRSGRIYIQSDDGDLLPLEEAAYEAEDVLQAELADHPALLALGTVPLSEDCRVKLVHRGHCISRRLRRVEFRVILRHLRRVRLRALGGRRPKVRKKII